MQTGVFARRVTLDLSHPTVPYAVPFEMEHKVHRLRPKS
jgi:hypothetical protein